MISFIFGKLPFLFSISSGHPLLKKHVHLFTFPILFGSCQGNILSQKLSSWFLLTLNCSTLNICCWNLKAKNCSNSNLVKIFKFKLAYLDETVRDNLTMASVYDPQLWLRVSTAQMCKRKPEGKTNIKEGGLTTQSYRVLREKSGPGFTTGQGQWFN